MGIYRWLVGLIFVAAHITVQHSFSAHELQGDPAALSPPFKHLTHPVEAEEPALNWFSGAATVLSAYPPRSDLERSLRSVTPVRSQGGRGTCSIFSTVAWFEAFLSAQGAPVAELDLSEEWLEHLAARSTGVDGSETPINFNLISDWGMASEHSLRYISQDWQEKDLRDQPKPMKRCGHLHGTLKKSCLIGHWDPQLLDLDETQLRAAARQLGLANEEAQEWRLAHLPFGGKPKTLQRVRDIKSALARGTPVVLDLEFFYGAWNHYTADNLKIGRNQEAYLRGEVGYPEPDSLDRTRSPRKPTGHSVLVVGYDDDETVETTVKLANGKLKTFTYKGVYYFKNSWGRTDFGRHFEAQGLEAPGFGRITQKYAHEFGAFIQFEPAR